MGDRVNVKLVYSEGEPIYLYSHWGGHGIKNTIKEALERGRDRWDDESYLARIIFSQMIKDEVMETTGHGIAPYETDPENPTVTVDLGNNEVNGKSFEEFIGGNKNG